MSIKDGDIYCCDPVPAYTKEELKAFAEKLLRLAPKIHLSESDRYPKKRYTRES